MKVFYFSFILILFFTSKLSAQKHIQCFSGELIYEISNIQLEDSIQEKMLIYAKDSLLKVINFSTTMGSQELIKHLRLDKSYLLISTTKGSYAIKTDYNKHIDTTSTLTYKKVLGRKTFCGKKAKKLKVTFKDIDKKFYFYYFKDIPSKYSSAYQFLPGLPVEYYIPTDQGLIKYQLASFKSMETPLQLFMIPENFKKVTLEEFLLEISVP